jgi:type II secretory pathway pseudopilin PulG
MRSNRRKFRKQGFTLVEMLVVLGIMIVILVSAVPVFNTMTGNHSLAAAQNQVAAALGTARSDAVYYRQTIGMFFFVDPTTGQVAMAEVQADPQTNGGTTYVPGTTYAPIGISPNNSLTPNNGSVNALELVNNWDSTQGKFIYYRDFVLLPANVGIALNNNYYGYVYSSGSTSQTFDRYVRLGAVLFDANGMLTSIPFAVQEIRQTPNAVATPVSQLGRRLGLHGVTPSDATASGDLASILPATGGPSLPTGQPGFSPPASGLYPLISQVALVFYDRDAFLNQKSQAGDSFTDQDLQYQLPSQSGTNVTPADKADEETWLDQNGTAVLVSPNNGSLINAK